MSYLPFSRTQINVTRPSALYARPPWRGAAGSEDDAALIEPFMERLLLTD
jgi:hypothetical protein